jgi:IS30 family transposase
LALLRKAEQRTANQVSMAMDDLLKPVLDCVNPLTFNNGKEFAEHKQITRELNADFFFAHPYAAWERGSMKT